MSLALPGLQVSRSEDRLRITAEGRPQAAVDINYITILAATKGGKVMTYDGSHRNKRGAAPRAQGSASTSSLASRAEGSSVANTSTGQPQDEIIWTTPGSKPRTLGRIAMGLGKQPPVKPFMRGDVDPGQRDASERELDAKRRVLRLRRELSRSRSTAANMQVAARRTNAGTEVRNMTRYLQGAHLSGSVKQVTPATEEQVKAVATALIQHLHDTRVDPNERNWYRLFREYDSNGDGHIEYRELVDMIRNHIKMSERQLPEREVQAVWHFIDADGNGWIDAGEFGRFFRQGEQAYKKEVRRNGPQAPRAIVTPLGRKREMTLAEINLAATMRSTQLLEQEEAKLQRELKRSSASLASLTEAPSTPGMLPPLR